MRILHYSLGFPPYRSGGLTTFCMDLMIQQHNDGHDVGLLWPGTMLGGFPFIIKKSPVQGIECFELINPQPIPYDEGIIEIDQYMQDISDKVFLHFLKKLNPEVIHIHTFMGLYAAFLSAAKKLGIKTVFTTHDFFPICPKVTMFRDGQNCNMVESCDECPKCNTTALSSLKIGALQSPIYRSLKDNKFVSTARRHHRDNYFSNNNKEIETNRIANDYLRLRSYYKKMYQKIDVIHFNSQIVRNTYERYFGECNNSFVIPVSHSAIKDNRKHKEFLSSTMRIRYLGGPNSAKGYYLLKDALDELWQTNKHFILDLHFRPSVTSPYMRIYERYGYSDLEALFDQTDLMIAPSICVETFGFTVLEAISYGVPVLISGTVGARDILSQGAAIIIEDIDKDKLVDAISKITPSKLETMNSIITTKQPIVTLSAVANRIMIECYSCD